MLVCSGVQALLSTQHCEQHSWQLTHNMRLVPDCNCVAVLKLLIQLQVAGIGWCRCLPSKSTAATPLLPCWLSLNSLLCCWMATSWCSTAVTFCYIQTLHVAQCCAGGACGAICAR
jgi:hypothetical protein